MKTYDVTIEATVIKIIRVEAENEDEAYVLAHESFSVLEDGNPESYTQESLGIKEITAEGEQA